MSRLDDLTGLFDKLREQKDYAGIGEDVIMEALTKLNISQYETVLDIPTRVINELLIELTDSKCPRLDANQEQEMLDFFECVAVSGSINLQGLVKCLRYLLRPDATCRSALLIVDVQNDFISGNLALKNSPAGEEAEEVVEIINNILESVDFHCVVYTLDWHPADHCSFFSNVSKYPLDESSAPLEEMKCFCKAVYAGDKICEQTLWPDHCVQGTEGAELHPDLKVIDGSVKICKGISSTVDSYSAFWDNSKFSQTDLILHLFDSNITKVFVCGLALDYCVGFTALDAIEHGFHTYIVRDACRGVSGETMEEMTAKVKSAGVNIIQVDSLLNQSV